MRPSLLAAIALTVATTIAAPLAAQEHAEHTQQPKPLVDETFTVPGGEYARVMLAGGETYRVEIAGQGLTLQLRPVQSGVQDPLVQSLLPGEASSGTVLYTVKPRADAEYELRAVGGDAGRATRVRITVAPKKPA